MIKFGKHGDYFRIELDHKIFLSIGLLGGHLVRTIFQREESALLWLAYLLLLR
jgi:hypothetical protein